MDKKKLIHIIENICPLSLAEDWDNCGFQIHCGSKEIQRVLVALEVTGDVIDEAEKVGAEMILTHHPLLFRGIKAVDNNDVIGNYIFRLIKAGIDVYSCHTNFDKADGGNNDYLGKLLNMQNIRPFDADNGFCRKGELAGEMALAELAAETAARLGIEAKYVRAAGNPTAAVKTTGWCTGAGTEFIADAAAEGCDVFITGDLKYHEAQLAKEMGMAVIDAGHYGSERIFTENMTELLKGSLAEAGEALEVVPSEIEVNPFI